VLDPFPEPVTPASTDPFTRWRDCRRLKEYRWDQATFRAVEFTAGLAAAGMAGEIPLPGGGARAPRARQPETPPPPKLLPAASPKQKYYTPQDRVMDPNPETGKFEPDCRYPHCQLGVSSRGAEPQAVEWDRTSGGKLIPKWHQDLTDHGTPDLHTDPHQHQISAGDNHTRSQKSWPIPNHFSDMPDWCLRRPRVTSMARSGKVASTSTTHRKRRGG